MSLEKGEEAQCGERSGNRRTSVKVGRDQTRQDRGSHANELSL